MAKRHASKTAIEKVQNLSYQQLGKSIVSGELSVKELKLIYSDMRSTAMKRINRLNSPENVRQFGEPKYYQEDGDYFRKTKNLVTTSSLLREISDVSRFLNTKNTTISGLKKERNYYIDIMKEKGFDVTNADYPTIKRFMKWFKSTEYAKRYGSDNPVVTNVYNTERPTEEDWERAFAKFKELPQNGTAPSRKY